MQSAPPNSITAGISKSVQVSKNLQNYREPMFAIQTNVHIPISHMINHVYWNSQVWRISFLFSATALGDRFHISPNTQVNLSQLIYSISPENTRKPNFFMFSMVTKAKSLKFDGS